MIVLLLFRYLAKRSGLVALLLGWLFCSISTSPVAAQTLVVKKLLFDARRPISAMAALPDGSFVICGSAELSTKQGVIAKLDSSGAIVWARLLNATDSGIDLQAVKALPDGSVLICGDIYTTTTYHSPLVMKLSAGGDEQWCYRYNIGRNASANNLCIMSDGSIVVAGSNSFSSKASTGGILLKLDAEGTALWCNGIFDFNPQPSPSFDLRGLVELPDHTLIVAGTDVPSNFVAKSHIILLKIQPDGAIADRTLLTDSNQSISLTSLLLLSTGEMVIGGDEVIRTNEPASPILICLDSLRQLRWMKQVSFFTSQKLLGLQPTIHGDIIGISIDEFFSKNLFQFDRSGTLKSASQLNDSLTTVSSFTPLHTSPPIVAAILSPSVISSSSLMQVQTFSEQLAGCNTVSNLGSTRIPDLRFDAADGIQMQKETVTRTSVAELQAPNDFTTLSVCSMTLDAVTAPEPTLPLVFYPNPVSQHSRLTVSLPLRGDGEYDIIVRDITGKEMYHERLQQYSSQSEVQLPIVGLTNGIYTIELVNVSTFSQCWRGKIVVQ